MFHRNRFLLLLLALAFSLTMFTGCSSDDDPGTPNDDDNNNSGLEDVGSISGIISRSNGSTIEGAVISTGTHSATSNEDGYFVLTAVPEGPALVAFSGDGFMSTFRVAEVRSDNAVHFPGITLLVVESAVINSTSGGEVATTGNIGVADFAANSFVNAAGDNYSGDVTIEINAMNTDNDDFYGSFPGEFAGIREDGSEVTLVSYGFMNIQMLADDKSPLQLADGTTAELTLTISSDKAATAPATIPMWYFDETDGQWYEEGQAVLSGNSYTADVAHFTTWNWDVPIEDICSISGFVVDDLGLPVEGARVLSRGVDAAIMAEDFTGTDGSFTVDALKNSITDVWAVSGSRASEAFQVTVLEECPVVLADPLELMVPAYAITLTWGELPADLDSHWYIPMIWNSSFDFYHIYYSSQGLFSADPFASLDTDDTSSYGPEIISGTRLYDGRFQYWVHNYDDEDSEGLKNSGASVQLEIGGALYQYNAIDVPLENADTNGWWHVFDVLYSATGAIITVEPVMEFQPEYTSGNIFEENGDGGRTSKK